MLVRVKQFGIDNAGDFSGIATTKFGEIGTIVDDVEATAAAQQSGFAEAAQQFEVKDTARENVREEMSDISRTAKSMEYEFDGISDKFRFQRNLNDADLLAKGRAFVIEAGPYKGNFIDYGLDSNFLDELTAAADAFEATFSTAASAQAEHVAATADTADKIRVGLVAVRISLASRPKQIRERSWQTRRLDISKARRERPEEETASNTEDSTDEGRERGLISSFFQQTVFRSREDRSPVAIHPRSISGVPPEPPCSRHHAN